MAIKKEKKTDCSVEYFKKISHVTLSGAAIGLIIISAFFTNPRALLLGTVSGALFSTVAALKERASCQKNNASCDKE